MSILEKIKYNELDIIYKIKLYKMKNKILNYFFLIFHSIKFIEHKIYL
jgi:hypothetical protein